MPPTQQSFHNKKTTTIALLTVVYQNYDVLQDLFNNLAEQTDPDFRLYIADLSIDRKEVIEKRFPLSVITAENLGYAHGINVATQQAIQDGIELYCVMNDDVIVGKNYVKDIKAGLEQHLSSIIGAKIYYAKGYEYHKHYTEKERGHVLWYAGGICDWNNVYTTHRGVDEVDHGQYNSEEPTEFITGCFMAYDKQVVEKVGEWDESYFLYYEDADFCERAKRAGVALWYIPSICLWHKNSQSTDGAGSNLHVKYQTKNRLKFGLKYAPWRTKLHLIKNAIISLFSHADADESAEASP